MRRGTKNSQRSVGTGCRLRLPRVRMTRGGALLGKEGKILRSKKWRSIVAAVGIAWAGTIVQGGIMVTATTTLQGCDKDECDPTFLPGERTYRCKCFHTGKILESPWENTMQGINKDECTMSAEFDWQCRVELISRGEEDDVKIESTLCKAVPLDSGETTGTPPPDPGNYPPQPSPPSEEGDGEGGGGGAPS